MTSESCLECGANLTSGVGCQEIFDSFLVLEFTDPGFGEVHFLTVACFMIQHGRYSDEALIWIEQQLRGCLDEGLSNQQIRRRAARETGQDIRSWKVIRQSDALPLPKIQWSMTIRDVESNYQDAVSYREAIKRWARTVLEEMKPQIRIEL
jgi:hypothetical protein